MSRSFSEDGFYISFWLEGRKKKKDGDVIFAGFVPNKHVSPPSAEDDFQGLGISIVLLNL